MQTQTSNTATEGDIQCLARRGSPRSSPPWRLLTLGALAQPAWAVTHIDKCQTITQPGSYKLIKDLTAKEGCLVIKANGVTIALAKHTITGNAKGVGVRTFGDLSELFVPGPKFFRIKLTNGTIRRFWIGVAIGHHLASIESLHVTSNGEVCYAPTVALNGTSRAEGKRDYDQNMTASSISGGSSHAVTGEFGWLAGGLFQGQ